MKDKIELPKNGDVSKDTYNFYKLMLSKTYFLQKALEINPFHTHFSWIDFGILHIIKESQMNEFELSLLKINKYRGYNLIFPGCPRYIDFYNKNQDAILSYEFRHNCCWVFFGGFISGSRETLTIFAKEVSDFLKEFEKHQYIMWETNVWAHIYYFKCRSICEPYFVDTHDIRMFNNMNKSLQINICGGLGNQLFMIANMLSISNSQNIPYILSKTYKGTKERPSYWETVFHKLNYTEKSQPLDKTIKESDNTIIDIPIIDSHILLDGYFQSSKYFSNINFSDVFDLPPPEKMEIENKFNEIRTKNHGKKINFIHVRRGDYLSLQYFHIVLSIDYYKRAIKHFDKDDVFLIFSDDIDWCKENFDFIEHKEFVKSIDYIELFLMTKCDGAIVANSSFSWWGAYLMNPNNIYNKKIICPEYWFTDYFPQREKRNESYWIEEKI